MTILLSTNFLQREIILLFPRSSVRTTDEVDHPWCISSHGELLGVLSSNLLIYAMLSNKLPAWCGYRVLIVTLGIEVF